MLIPIPQKGDFIFVRIHGTHEWGVMYVGVNKSLYRNPNIKQPLDVKVKRKDGKIYPMRLGKFWGVCEERLESYDLLRGGVYSATPSPPISCVEIWNEERVD